MGELGVGEMGGAVEELGVGGGGEMVLGRWWERRRL